MIVPVNNIQRFKLQESFLDEYRTQKPNWGFGLISEVTFKRTYARDLDDGGTESWWQTCQRVVEGVLTIQKAHNKSLNLAWNNRKAQRTAQDMYHRMFNFKWLPPGRGLWAMGTEFVYEKGGAALNNCAFISTKNISEGLAQPFVWAFSMSMYGVGVGFDTRGEGSVEVKEPRVSDDVYVVGDSREGWGEALDRCITAFSGKGSLPSTWDFSKVRPAGEPIKGFGGVASGPDPLRVALERIETLLRDRVGERISEADIVDIMNICGACVVAGGIRRTAQIAFGKTEDFMSLKSDYEAPEMAWRWASNNSLFAEVGQDYNYAAGRTAINGEPGYAWLENMRNYGRMKDGFNPDADPRVEGGNPCLEQSLEHGELCCLVETFPASHDSFEDYMQTLKMAYMYAKTVTLVPTHDQLTNAVMLRNRRIGCSMSGIVQAIEKLGLREFTRWCDEGYAEINRLDKVYSSWMCVPLSIKKTSVKPSGTVSILAGATPGLHFDHSPYYIRRVRMADTSPIWKDCQDAGYKVEKDTYADNTMVVEFPICSGTPRGKSDVSMWEQVSLAAMMQHYWADNQVSCTVNFSSDEAPHIKHVLTHFEDRLKGISFLPTSEHGYAQAPYEEITEDEYNEIMSRVNPDVVFSDGIERDMEDKFCDGEACVIKY